jgi:hypothetical protein
MQDAPRWAGSHAGRFDAIINAELLPLNGISDPSSEDMGGTGPLSILLRTVDRFFTSTVGAAYTAKRTEDPKNRPGDTLGKYSRANVPSKACNHIELVSDDDGVGTGNTVQNP